MQVLITCEHTTKTIPADLHALFFEYKELCNSHRGYDIGALALAYACQKRLQAPLITSTVSRLVIDLNRSLKSKTLFSEITKQLSEERKKELIERYYFPYRNAVFDTIRRMSSSSFLLHLSIHSFTPVFKGVVRNVDLGLLYDPKREAETIICKVLKEQFCLRSSARALLNQPYRGTSDGLVTYLRTQFPSSRYAGIEIEMNQRFALRSKDQYSKIFLKPLLDSLEVLVARSSDAGHISVKRALK